jgi:polysaccharide biosynthesis protein PslJ
VSAHGAQLSRGFAPAFILAAVALLAASAVSGHGVKLVAPVVILAVSLAAWQRSLLQWHSLVGLVLAVVLFVPIGRYGLPGSLPFNLELYRIVVAAIVLLWLTSLLIDPKVRLERTYFDWPLLLLLGCILCSELFNPGRVNAVSDNVAKTLTFFLSFILVYYVTATTLRGRRPVMFVLKLLVLGGVVIAACAIFEQRTGFNAFDHVQSVLPFLQSTGALDAVSRGGNLRVFGPSQHPIALGAALILILPVAVYFARSASRRWWFAAVLIVLGALASGSRTALTMLAAEVVLYLCLKPTETKRLWPALVPAVVVIHTFLPGQIGSFKEAFFPKGGIVQEATQVHAGSDLNLQGGRIRQLRPMISEASLHPLFGEGLGTRLTGFNTPDRNAPILDNQWLNNLLDVGYVGFGIWVWLFVRAVRRLVRESRRSEDEGDQWLFAGLAAAMVAFPIGMLTFDAFSFTQVPFLFWIMLGLSAALIRESDLRRRVTPSI